MSETSSFSVSRWEHKQLFALSSDDSRVLTLLSSNVKIYHLSASIYTFFYPKIYNEDEFNDSSDEYIDTGESPPCFQIYNTTTYLYISLTSCLFSLYFTLGYMFSASIMY